MPDIIEYDNWEDVYRDMEEDFDRFPLPIEFDPLEELKQLNLRKMHLERLAQRWFIQYKRKKIIENFQNIPEGAKPYIHARYKPE